jgi:hypothetical protein
MLCSISWWRATKHAGDAKALRRSGQIKEKLTFSPRVIFIDSLLMELFHSMSFGKSPVEREHPIVNNDILQLQTACNPVLSIPCPLVVTWPLPPSTFSTRNGHSSRTYSFKQKVSHISY